MYNIYQCLRETKALSISTRLWSYQSVIWNPHKIKRNCDNKLDMVSRNMGKLFVLNIMNQLCLWTETTDFVRTVWACTKHMSSTCDEKIVYQLTDIKSRNSNYLSEKKTSPFFNTISHYIENYSFQIGSWYGTCFHPILLLNILALIFQMLSSNLYKAFHPKMINEV